MTKLRCLSALAASALLLPPVSLPAQHGNNAAGGLFTRSTDIGVTREGSTDFDAAHGIYRVTGGGADMWGKADAFRFTWVQITGDTSLTADVEFGPGSHAPLEKGVLMLREGLDPGSAYADIALHGDGHITLQYRATRDGKTEDQTAPAKGPTRLRIERRGNHFTASTAISGSDTWTPFASVDIPLHNPVYVGLGVCAHNQEGSATVAFSNVKLLGSEPARIRGVQP